MQISQGDRPAESSGINNELQSEQFFLENYNPSDFEHPSVTVDILVFTVTDGKLCVLLLKRREHPFKGKWAIPGGFIGMDESADDAAIRRIREEAGVENAHLEQLYTFSAVNRDPRTRVISIAFLAAVPFQKLHFHAGIDAEEASIFAINGIQGERASVNPERAMFPDDCLWTLTGLNGELVPASELAFDHDIIIQTAVRRMRGKLNYTDIAFGFLEDPDAFTLTELRVIHEAILGHHLDVPNFRRTILREYLSKGRIIERGLEKGVVGRPAMLYSLQSSSEQG